jgi:peptidoglycan/xylan/chitin deacetylase (PgdA/CDA1 family)
MTSLPAKDQRRWRFLDYFPLMQRVSSATDGIAHPLSKRTAAKLPILSYHNVGPSHPGVHPLLTVSPERFAKQMGWLARRGYAPIQTKDWYAWLKEGRALPKRPILITFDDGYSDMAEYALPVLRRYGFKAVVYIVTRLTGRTNEWDTRIGFGELPLMTEGQIDEWAAQGIEFGAHTRDHIDLRTLPRNELEDQVFGSADDLKRLLGAAPPSFCYPYGHFNQDVTACVAQAFQTSVTVEEAICSDHDDPLLMPRIWIRPDEELSKFAQRVKSGTTSTLRQKLAIRSRLGLLAKLLRSPGADRAE